MVDTPVEVPKSGLVSQTTYGYMRGFFLKAAAKDRTQEEFSSADVLPLKSAYTASSKSSTFGRIKAGRGLLRSLIREIGLPFYLLVALHALELLLSPINPMLSKRFLLYFECGDKQAKEGLWLVAGMIALSGFNFIMSSLREIFYSQVQVQAHSLTTSYMVEKASRLSALSLEKCGSSKLLLLYRKALQVSDFCMSFNLYWSNPLSILISLWMLVAEVGWPLIFAVALSLISHYFNMVLARRNVKIEEDKDHAQQKLDKIVSEHLRGVKAIKLNCWEEYTCSKLHDCYSDVRDINTKWRVNYQLGVMQKELFSQAIIIVALLLSCWVEGKLTAANAYLLLMLYNRLRYPLFAIGELYTDYVQQQVHVKMIEEFLAMEEQPPRNEELSKGEVQLENVTAMCLEHDNHSENGQTVPRLRVGLNDLGVHIKPGQLMGVAGAVGGGKTLFLRAMLGEVACDKGRVRYGGSMVYLPHEPWIVSDTLRDNIVMGQTFNQTKYDEVIALCHLQADIARMPQHDLTLIGTRGINMSGGQRQRLVLARALYADADIYLLDDCLSQLDPEVATQVFQDVILTRLKGKTRVFVTNDSRWLQHTGCTILLEQGKITCMGTYTEVYQHSPDLFQPRESQAATKEQDADHRNDNDNDSNGSMNNANNADTEAAKATEKANKERKIVGRWECVKKLWSYANPWGLAAVWALGILSAVCLQWRDRWLFAWGYDTLNASLYFYIGTYAGLICVSTIIFALPHYIRKLTEKTFLLKLHGDMGRRIFNAPLMWHAQHESGTLKSKLDTGFDAATNVISKSLNTLAGVVSILSIFYQILFYYPEYFFSFAAMLIAFRYLQVAHSSLIKYTIALNDIIEDHVATRLQEYLEGLCVVRAPGNRLHDCVKQRLYQSADHKTASSLMITFTDRWMSYRWHLLTHGVYYLMLIHCFVKRDLLAPSVIALLLLLLGEISSQLESLFIDGGDLLGFLWSSARILNFLGSIPPEPAFRPPLSVPSAWPHRGAVAAAHLKLQYKPTLPLVINDANFSIRGGEKVALRGRTGCGKSTIFLGLLRLIEPSSDSEVNIDQLPLSQTTHHNLRSRVTMIPQEAWVFAGSVKDNVDPMRRLREDEIVTMLQKLRLKELLEKKLASKADSILDLQIAEGGSNLSQGEKQLLCIARALVRRPKVLLLDEATASLDDASDEMVQQLLHDDFDDSTIIMISHRDQSLRLCTRAINVEDGKCIEAQRDWK